MWVLKVPDDFEKASILVSNEGKFSWSAVTNRGSHHHPISCLMITATYLITLFALPRKPSKNTVEPSDEVSNVSEWRENPRREENPRLLRSPEGQQWIKHSEGASALNNMGDFRKCHTSLS